MLLQLISKFFGHASFVTEEGYHFEYGVFENYVFEFKLAEWSYVGNVLITRDRVYWVVS